MNFLSARNIQIKFSNSTLQGFRYIIYGPQYESVPLPKKQVDADSKILLGENDYVSTR